MCILVGFNYLVEQRKQKLYLFEVILKTTLTQMKSKKINTQAESEGYPGDIKQLLIRETFSSSVYLYQLF